MSLYNDERITDSIQFQELNNSKEYLISGKFDHFANGNQAFVYVPKAFANSPVMKNIYGEERDKVFSLQRLFQEDF